MKQFSVLSFYILLFSTLLFGCKKDIEEIPEEQLPVFGTCEQVNPEGNISLSGSNNGILTYNTSGGGKIVIDPAGSITITHNDYPGFKLEFWGDAGPLGIPLNSANHENLNGKHIKDRIDVRRTIIFPDGAKITTLASGFAGPLTSISIYDGEESHYINTNCNYIYKLEHSSTNAAIAKQLDDSEPDGETGIFEFTETGLLFLNIYTEDIAGQKVEKRVPLGVLFKDDPNRVDDYYDDPRYEHT
jgi:hypothetical protein